MLDLVRVSKLYESAGERIRAVDGVSMRVEAREFVAILGPSGSGKTTLLLLAGGMLRADSGTVLFDGSDLAALGKRDVLAHRRTMLGLVFQGFHLSAGLTAEENVAIPLLLRGVTHREAHRRALAALDDVELARRASHTPEKLSGGEQQRVAIARALVGAPRLVLADEPTGNLDSDTGNAVIDLLATLPRERGAAVILVTHDAHAASHANRALTMRDGILGEGELDRHATIGACSAT